MELFASIYSFIEILIKFWVYTHIGEIYGVKGIQRKNAINKQREEQTKKEQQEFREEHKKEVDEEEHIKRVTLLKQIGILKD